MNDRLSTMRCAVKRYLPALLIAIIALISIGCAGTPTGNDNSTYGGAVKENASVVAGAGEAIAATPAVRDGGFTPPTAPRAGRGNAAGDVVEIALGDTITVDGLGALADGNTVRITAGGTYRLSGTLMDGQIVVDTRDKTTVNLVLDGVDITCSSSAPIYIMRADTTTITLADGTENHITDGVAYQYEGPETNEPNAAIFSKGDLIIAGNGSLTVDANYRNAIASKDELSILGGNIAVNAVNDGIRGRDYISVKNGNITINAGADGMQSDNDSDPELGYVSIEGGAINVTAGKDGIQAASTVFISGGTITVSSGGGSANSGGSDGSTTGGGGAPDEPTGSNPTPSSKGIKADFDIAIEGGTITVDSFDDAIHSNDTITIDGGNIVLASGDDAIHSDSSLTVNGGDIIVTKSYEAIESAVIAINGGNIRLVANDDGVNIAADDNRAGANRRPGQANAGPPMDKQLRIEGGYIVIDASGDGFDINGWVKMTGGTVIINGPIVDFNGALDYAREFTMVGGTLLAVGSSGMAQAPDATSTQYSLVLNLGSPQPAGTLVHIEGEDGTGILTFEPLREFQSVVFSSPELIKGSTYEVYIGGSSTGSIVDGVYYGGSYTPGTRNTAFTVSSIEAGVGPVARGLPDGKR